jgi:hypothetical protein
MNFGYPGPLQQNINHRNLLESTYYLQIPHPNGKYLKMRLITQDAPKLIVESVWKAGRGLGTPEKQSSILLH